MTDFQICIAAISKMPWLLIIPIALIGLGVVEAVNRKRNRRARLEKKAMEEVTKRNEFKREYHQKHIAGRY